MAADMFLKLDGIKGESHDDKHKDEIEVLSFSWGVSQSGTAGYGGGAGAGKASFQDMQIQKRMDSASPILFKHCATGHHIKEATFVARKAGGDKQEYLIIKLNDILVSSLQSGGTGHGGGGDETPHETISLNFSKFEADYKPQKQDGTLGAAIKAGYDLKAGKAT